MLPTSKLLVQQALSFESGIKEALGVKELVLVLGVKIVFGSLRLGPSLQIPTESSQSVLVTKIQLMIVFLMLLPTP